MASVRKRTWQTKDGPRTAWLVAYRSRDRKQHVETFATKGEAVDRRREIEGELKSGAHTPVSSKVTLGDAARAWIERGEAEGKERSTIEQRRQHVDLHILPLLGDVRLAKLTRPQVEAFRDQLLRKRSPAMARKVLTSVKSLLKDAQSRGLVGQNAARDVEIRVDGRHKRRLEVGIDVPTPAEVRSLIEAAAGYDKALLVVLVFGGLRISEALALRWQDADLKGRRIHVRQRANKWGAVGSLKSESGYRSVPMAPIVASTLEAWRGDRIFLGEALVFATRAGTVQSQANIWNRVLGPLQIAAGVVDRDGKAKYGAHAFRHFFASWRINEGDNVKRVSVLMGHSSPVITLTLYAHMLPAEDEHERFAAGEQALLG